MKYTIIISLIVGLFGCSANDSNNLFEDLDKSLLTKVSYKVGGFKTFECDPSGGQIILKAWYRTLKEAAIASWPDPDNYLELTFKNGHKYKIRVFIGEDKLKYSVLYSHGVYTGEQLRLESVCHGLEIHNKLSKNFAIENALSD